MKSTIATNYEDSKKHEEEKGSPTKLKSSFKK